MLDAMLTSNVSEFEPGHSAIGNIVDDEGSLIDDVPTGRGGPITAQSASAGPNMPAGAASGEKRAKPHSTR